MANVLTNNSFIRKFLAGFILLVFAFSITPKILLHNVIANHTDTPFSSNTEKHAQLHKAGFNCTIDNLVVESSFIQATYSTPVEVQIYPSSLLACYSGGFIRGYECFLHLRGPPAVSAA